MSRNLVNLRRRVIQAIPDTWYHLDEEIHCLEPPNDAIWKDPNYRICSRYQDSFYRFYLVNNIEVTPQLCSTTDVQQVSVEDLYRLTNFSLEGLFTKARVLRIIDARHLEIAFFVPFDLFAKYQPSTQNYGITRRVIPYHSDTGFFMRERCVLKNIGRPSHEEVPVPDKEVKAQLGLELLTAWCNTLGNIVYVEFGRQGESRDRPITIYSDVYRSISINQELLAHRHPQVGNLYHEELSPPESFLYEKYFEEEEDLISDIISGFPINL